MRNLLITFAVCVSVPARAQNDPLAGVDAQILGLSKLVAAARAELEPEAVKAVQPFKAQVDELNRQDAALAEQWKDHDRACHEPYVKSQTPEGYAACVKKHSELKTQSDALEKKQKEVEHVILELPAVKKLNDAMKSFQPRWNALQQQKKAIVEAQQKLAKAAQAKAECLHRAESAGDEEAVALAKKACLDQTFDGTQPRTNPLPPDESTRFFAK